MFAAAIFLRIMSFAKVHLASGNIFGGRLVVSHSLQDLFICGDSIMKLALCKGFKNLLFL